MPAVTENASVEPANGAPSPEEPAENEHRYRKLLEALPDAILVHSDNKIVFVNPFCVQLFGAEGPEQLLGKDVSQIVAAEYLPAIVARIRECYATGLASPAMESIVIACDGSPVEIEAIAIPISWNGSPAIEVVLRDIRKRKQAELAAQAMAETPGTGAEGRPANWIVGLGRSRKYRNLVRRKLSPVRIRTRFVLWPGGGRRYQASSRRPAQVEEAIQKVIAGGVSMPRSIDCYIPTELRAGLTRMA